MAIEGEEFDCFNCGTSTSLVVRTPTEAYCRVCNLVAKLVMYDCRPQRHCCPDGYVACPQCKGGKPTKTQCFASASA